MRKDGHLDRICYRQEVAGVASDFNLLILLGEEKGTFSDLCMDQRLSTPFVLGTRALELLFEFRIGFTPENRQVVKLQSPDFEKGWGFVFSYGGF